MKNKYYNLTEQANKGVTDNAPEWMETLFEKDGLTKKSSSENPFKGSDNFLVHASEDTKVQTCKGCGQPLKDNEVDYCSNCC